MKAAEQAPIADAIVRRHLRAGYVGLAIFIVLGVVLEGFHATKAPLFLDAENETTRLLLRLAHAHGTLVALVNIVYALTVKAHEAAASKGASAAALLALVLLPSGFFLGALFVKGADPGLGIILVPTGAIALLVFAVVTARRI